MADYEKSKQTALKLAKKLFEVRLVKCSTCIDAASVMALIQLIGAQVLDLCVKSECFLEDFEHILETSDGTPKSHKERGL